MDWHEIEKIILQIAKELFGAAANFPSSRTEGFALAAALALYGAIRLTTVLLNFRALTWARSMGMTELMHWRYNFGIGLFLALSAFQIFLHTIRYLGGWECSYDAYQPVELLANFAVLSMFLLNFKDLVLRTKEKEYKTSLWKRLKYAYSAVEKRGVTLPELVFAPVAFSLPWRMIFLFLAEKA